MLTTFWVTSHFQRPKILNGPSTKILTKSPTFDHFHHGIHTATVKRSSLLHQRVVLARRLANNNQEEVPRICQQQSDFSSKRHF